MQQPETLNVAASGRGPPQGWERALAAAAPPQTPPGRHPQPLCCSYDGPDMTYFFDRPECAHAFYCVLLLGMRCARCFTPYSQPPLSPPARPPVHSQRRGPRKPAAQPPRRLQVFCRPHRVQRRRQGRQHGTPVAGVSRHRRPAAERLCARPAAAIPPCLSVTAVILIFVFGDLLGHPLLQPPCPALPVSLYMQDRPSAQRQASGGAGRTAGGRL